MESRKPKTLDLSEHQKFGFGQSSTSGNYKVVAGRGGLVFFCLEEEEGTPGIVPTKYAGYRRGHIAGEQKGLRVYADNVVTSYGPAVVLNTVEKHVVMPSRVSGKEMVKAFDFIG